MPFLIRKSIGTVAWRGLVTLLYLFLLAPIIIIVVISFGTQEYLSFPPQGFTTRWFEMLPSNSDFMTGLGTSLVIALIVSVISTAVAVPAALALSRYRFRSRAVLSGMFLSPLMLPTVVLGLALFLVLIPFGLVGTYPGLVFAHLAITLPYVVRTTEMSLLTVDTSCEAAAKILGAGPWATFWRVTLPLIRPGVIAGAVMAAIVSFDEAVISLYIAGQGATTLPVYLFRYAQTQTDPQLAALSTVLIVGSVLVVVIVERTLGLSKAVGGA